MSKNESFTQLSLGFLVFLVVFIRIGFFFHIPISKFTLIASFLVYLICLVFAFAVNIKNQQITINKFASILWFIAITSILAVIAFLLGNTFDLSWDGQGYHQSAVIALSNGWNPITTTHIHLKQTLPAQIFSESYPSSLWEIQAAVNALFGKINSAKVLNIAIGIISFTTMFALLKKFRLSGSISAILSFLVIFQPVFILQLMTFMSDGFGYQLFVIAFSSLIYFMISPNSNWAITIFIFAEFFLVSTKYNHLPVALVLGIVFIVQFVNHVLNKEYKVLSNFKYYIAGFFITAIIFAYLPYVRNFLVYQTPFYPTNVEELSGAIKYNNVPNDLKDKNKLTLLFYGLFSRSQSANSGYAQSAENVSQLKLPFTFSLEEIYASASLHNNRVGAGGALFSGLIIFCLLLVIFASLKTENKGQRYAIYISLLSLMFLLFLALLNPNPNLLRYSSQLQLIPYALVIPVLIAHTKSFVRILGFFALIIATVNVLWLTLAVANYNQRAYKAIQGQFNEMKNDKEYLVSAQHFYSNYVLLEEQGIQFMVTDFLECESSQPLIMSTQTTWYCEK